MKKVISSLIVLTALFSQTAFAGEKISKEERQALSKECRAELKAAGSDMSDKEAIKAQVKECVKGKIKAKQQ
ncbi:hypothetical protein DS2_15889 [Catenovulum agarivorans DS-2]|uniref:PsiF repeat-containing protein n=1 Tax=Catenovulum agarivorans DS-2 TaxID=1328313 RepID=W7QTH7_9ALTE|nr:hypothetical protein [Catenovulum agarivorans]EWH08730.1 hypothetical protein DS2_15889 [Catenovulum agarivorans DS-2]